MKTIKLLFLLSLFASSVTAQSFNQGLELYNSDQYAEAAELFSELNDDRSMLFAGKSYLAISELTLASRYLYEALESNTESIHLEALYSLALTHFELKNYAQSLEYLHQLMESQDRSGLRNDARRFYNQILDFVSVNQRFQLLHQLKTPSIRFDLVTRSKAYLDHNDIQLMVAELLKLTPDASERERIQQHFSSESELQRVIQSYPSAPIGTVYNVGVILPEFDESDPDFTIPRNLYFGMVLAANDFNSRNIDQKVRLIFRNSYEEPDSTAKAFTDMVWKHKIDAVIGPLFSEPAIRMAQLAEEFEIPMLAPLANSDSLNRNFIYTYQLNPTFAVHGKKMARFAVEDLQLNSFAIITEPMSLGRASALAFRHEAERLGANISYYIEEDFASTGYDLTEVMQVFTPNEELRDSLNYYPTDAIYAPFTGQASSTMMNLMLNGLEGMRSDVTILGSEEWEFAQLTSFQNRFFEIYYTQSFGEPLDQSAVNFFQDDYETRYGSEPDRFSHLGYDAATYLFQSLERAGNPVYLEKALRSSPEHRGLSLNINFDGHRINQHLFIRPLSDNAKAKINQE
tara:strand:+ start:42343 stop:44058 length:1716 start_codon:yes stop_codon:yes gene_type:complete